MKKFKAVIDTLTEARDKISKLLSKPEDDNHRIAITHRLQMDIDKISLLHGIEMQESEPIEMGAATTIGGTVIKKVQRISEADTAPSNDAVKTLRNFVEEMYSKFLTIPNEEILKSDNLVVRGVAKKAGMNKVTKDNPEKITNAFIDEIKDLIRIKNQ